jgi:hypothetical protein
MARKVNYGKPLKYFWRHLYGTQKKFTPELSDDQIFTLLRNNIINAPMRAPETPESRSLTISGWELWRDDCKGNLMHIFFLDKLLRDFLEKTQLSDLAGIKKYLYENGRSNNVFHTYSKETTESVVYRFALHLPNDADGYAFSLSLESDGSVELYFSRGENGGRMSDKFYPDVNKKSDEVSLTHSKMFRLAINIISYMNCFPDCVADGVPKDLLFERNENLSPRNFTFQVSEKIREDENLPLSKIPHFRKGHFRILQSDYFTNKKGQIVFVAETMVKGKAKTVSMSQETDEFTRNAERTKI